MIEINQADFKLRPYAHQLRGIKTLIANPVYGLFWQMRLGKTKAIIDAASVLRKNGELDALVICCPAQVKDVWMHPKIGELQKHCFVEHTPIDFDSELAEVLDIWTNGAKGLPVVVVSHELVRQDDAAGDYPRVHQAKRALGDRKKVWLVFDEASAFGNHKSAQTKSVMHLRRTLGPSRVTTLDGTPVGNSPTEQYSKFGLLDEQILGYKNFFHFRAVHGVMEPSKFAKRGKAMVGFQRQDVIDRKVKAHCEYLAQEDCLDMPKFVKTFQTAALLPKSWRRYCDMRDEMVAELEDGRTASTQWAAVKTMRLAQMCSGFLGGVENEVTGEQETTELSCEVTDSCLKWLDRKLNEVPDFKAVIWCRWRAEIDRLVARLAKRFPDMGLGCVYGQKKDYDGQLHPDSPVVPGPFVLVAQPQAVRYGVNFSQADTELFLSSDYNLITRQQAEQRIQPGEGVRKTSLIVDFLVTGPAGQKTITWDIAAVLGGKEQTATRTTNEWKRVLTDV